MYTERLTSAWEGISLTRRELHAIDAIVKPLVDPFPDTFHGWAQHSMIPRQRSGPCWGIGGGPQQADFTGFRGGEKWKIVSCVPRNTAYHY